MSEEPRSPEQIEADIAQTRAELGDTVEALAAKTDVKARAQERVEEVKHNVKEKAPSNKDELIATVRANPVPFAVAGAVLALLILRRRRTRP